MFSRLIQCSLTAGLLLISGASYAESGRADYDLDNDGLIEINDLADLDEIRNNLDGATLYGESTGCLAEGCTGFELTTDLDFDTNQNGVIDDGDDFWNGGEGWLPVGTVSSSFTADFNGNGYSISNLMAQRSFSSYQGLFGTVADNTLSNLHLINARVRGVRAIGGLAGMADNARFSNIAVFGRIQGRHSVGGIAGSMYNSTACVGCAVSGVVEGSDYHIGGIAGVGGVVENSLILARVVSTSTQFSRAVGGVSGDDPDLIKNTLVIGQQDHIDDAFSSWGGEAQQSYWATDTTGKINSGISSKNAKDIAGVLLSELQCPTSANNTSCSGIELYKGWESATNEQGEAYWDFGTSGQLPALRVAGKLMRDSDGDGVVDELDAFPDQIAASLDSDNDGSPDFWNSVCDTHCQQESGLVQDQLPGLAAAIIDADLDGLPEAWGANCDGQCQLDSGLILDAFPNDSDNDGIPNDLDDDDNGDGLVDVDADSDGYIDVTTLEELNAIRFNLSGAGQSLSSNDPAGKSGCPIVIVDGRLQQSCSGYELLNDLNFDTNNDGVIDNQDAYWNSGNGWNPLGHEYNRFTGNFDGNGFTISHLMVNRSDDQGLFGVVRGSTISNLHLTRVSIVARGTAAALVGLAENSTLSNVSVAGLVDGDFFIGGVAGQLWDSVCYACASSGVIKSNSSAGAIAGYVHHSSLGNILSLASVVAKRPRSVPSDDLAGVVGDATSGVSISNALVIGAQVHGSQALSGTEAVASQSYWAIDTTGKINSGIESGSATDIAGVPIDELRCPTSANNTGCADVELFKNWDTAQNNKGELYWHFGTAEQLPALRVAGKLIRDTDGDGIVDEFDDFPNNIAASQDSDSDGAIDAWSYACDEACREASGLVLDQFIDNASASLDTDLDGMPEAWNANCDSVCQSDSGLELDLYPNDADNDGIIDALDGDDNNDGQPDADADSDGYIEIDSLDKLNAMRFDLAGRSLKLSNDAVADSSGCPLLLLDGQLTHQCKGYELTKDLSFDTNNNGLIDEGDAYWNNGQGWSPVGGTGSTSFYADFNGNGYAISHLMIDNTSNNQGLFKMTQGGVISNLHLVNVLVTANHWTGALVSSARHTSFSNINVSGRVTGRASVGGIAGEMLNSTCRGCAVSGVIFGANFVGGISGNEGVIENSLVLARVVSEYVGGVVGENLERIKTSLVIGQQDHRESALSDGSGIAEQVYWSIDTTGKANSGISPENATNIAGVLLSELQCPTSANNTGCAGVELYKGWDSATNDQGEAYWDFGSSQQLPALRVAGKLIRDSDGDGVLDEDDHFPGQYEISIDSDSDGYADEFNEYCDDTCQQKSALVIDQFPNNPDEWLDTDADGIGNNSDTDDDNDGVLDGSDAFPMDAAESLDTDSDGIGNNTDTDDDNDGVADGADAFPLNPSESLDTDNDGIGNNTDTDDDNDGVIDGADVFPLDAGETVDTDNDGIGNNADTDDDNDGIADGADAFPLNPSESLDTDNDGIGNNADIDDDNDGVLDGADAFPLDAGETIDTDNDGIGNNSDTDDDNDGVADGADAFPLNPSESLDTDNDGIGNNADTDDDNDGVLDGADVFPLDAGESIDTDNDGIGNNADTDDDNDGVLDIHDDYPLDASRSLDTDKDGIDNLVDTDDDNDGVLDVNDAFPLDANESVDTDADGIGNNADTDDDNDGVNDGADAFPLDASESVDTDLDGLGNNADTDDDNDGVEDYLDAFPLDVSESVDTDSDGIGNNADTDDDNDGVLDVDDAFPLNANESIDTDSDGFGNNEDVDDDNDMITDVWEEAYGFDPLDPNDALLDADNDGASNLDEFESGTDPRDADSVPAWLRGGGAWKYYLYKKAAEGATLQ